MVREGVTIPGVVSIESIYVKNFYLAENLTNNNFCYVKFIKLKLLFCATVRFYTSKNKIHNLLIFECGGGGKKGRINKTTAT